MATTALRLALAALLVVACAARDFGKGGVVASATHQRRRREPRLAFQIGEPVYELTPQQLAGGKPYLIQFTGKGDDYCKQMEPLKERLKDELGVEIRCFEVWYGTANLDLLQKVSTRFFPWQPLGLVGLVRRAAVNVPRPQASACVQRRHRVFADRPAHLALRSLTAAAAAAYPSFTTRRAAASSAARPPTPT